MRLLAVLNVVAPSEVRCPPLVAEPRRRGRRELVPQRFSLGLGGPDLVLGSQALRG